MRIPGLLLGVYLLIATPAAYAQRVGFEPPPQVTAGDMALNWLAGRYRMPVSCVTAEGSTLELSQNISFRPNQEAGDGKSALKVTLFGIEPPEAVERCYNLLQKDLPDRRGVMYVHFRYHERKDLGVADFRRLIKSGQLVYHVHRGLFKEQPIGGDESQGTLTKLEGGDSRIEVSMVQTGSDADKLLGRFQPDEPPTTESPFPARRLTLRFYGPEGLLFESHVVEAPGR